MKVDRILVPLDGSMVAETAMWTALDLAERNVTTISLLRAAVVYALLGADAVKEQVLAVHQAEAYLASTARRLQARGFARVETHACYGPAATAIVEAAKAQKADVIVMSTHGRSGLGRLILGSVVESVLRSTTVPILIVRAQAAPVDVPTGAASTRMTHA